MLQRDSPAIAPKRQPLAEQMDRRQQLKSWKLQLDGALSTKKPQWVRKPNVSLTFVIGSDLVRTTKFKGTKPLRAPPS
jgi:hypothetical protein